MLEQDLKVAEQKVDWDKEKQRIDQAEAVARKATLELEDARGELEDTKSQIAGLQAKIEQLTKPVEEELKLDPSLVDPNIVNAINKLQSQLKEERSKSSEIAQKISVYEQQETAKAQEKRTTEVIERVLSVVEEDFPAKFRNEAQKLADQWTDSGQEKKPATESDAIRLMKKCYRHLAEQEKLSTKKPAPTDSGKGGHSAINSDDIPKGSRADVLAAMRKKGGWITSPSE